MEAASQVSAALATYNGSRYISEQLASLATQTRKPAELVVSDDGSSDNTLDLVRSFARTAPFDVRILAPGPRLGFADNFLRAAEACRSEFVAFCDQDDVWLPEKLDLVMHRLSIDKSVCALHRLTLTDDALNPYDVWEQGISEDRAYEPLALPRYMHAWGNSMVFRHDILDVMKASARSAQPGKPEQRLSHDIWIYNISASLGRVSHIIKPLVLYRQHGHNASGAKRKSVSMLGRVAALAHVPLTAFREQEAYSRAMAEGFLFRAKQTGAQYQKEASAAAEEYFRITRIMKARCALYEAPSARLRRHALRDLQSLDGVPQRLGPLVKQTLLGVCGLNPFLSHVLAPFTPSDRL